MVRSVTMIAILWIALQPAAANADARDSRDDATSATSTTSVTSIPSTPSMCVDGQATQSQQQLTEALTSQHMLGILRGIDDAVPAKQDDNQTAWCISPDDPRCAPRETSTPLDTLRASVPACDFTAVTTLRISYDGVVVDHAACVLGAPLSGVHGSLERPPRA